MLKIGSQLLRLPKTLVLRTPNLFVCHVSKIFCVVVYVHWWQKQMQNTSLTSTKAAILLQRWWRRILVHFLCAVFLLVSSYY